MDLVNNLLKNLKFSCVSDDENALREHVENLLIEIHSKENSSAICEEIIKENIITVVKQALCSKNYVVQALSAELIAELSKVESCRISCVEASIVPELLTRLSDEHSATLLQVCRALGNLCYEYEKGRQAILENEGMVKLLALLKRGANLPRNSENRQLRLVATGFLLNLLNMYDISEITETDESLLDVICLYLDKFSDDTDIPTHLLLSLSCIADSDIGRDMLINREDLIQLLHNVLKSNESNEVIETCLEIITNLADSEYIKTRLSKNGVCETILKIIERHKKEKIPDISLPIIKTSTDLVVLVLAGDESMDLLYNNGEGTIYKAMVEWLSSDMTYLQVSAALAMGNFARSDTHCISMVKDGISAKLLHLMSKTNEEDADIRLQHAALSALRNLSIAPQNKEIIIQQKGLDILVPMLTSIEAYPVVFKLLATLRMLMDKNHQPATQIGLSSEAIKKIVGWCGEDDHPGIQGESARILAWIAKNCDNNKKVFECLRENGAVLPLICMLNSEYAVMVNESALALALLFSSSTNAARATVLNSTPFVQSCCTALKNDLVNPEVLCNVFTVLLIFSDLNELKNHELAENLLAVVQPMVSHQNEQLQSLANTLLKVLDK